MRDLVGRALAPHRPILALTLLAAVLYLPSVWLRDPWSPDEPRYAEVAREMVSSGEYILPHINGEVYAEKPPLFFWLGILAGSIPGVPFESGTRLVSVISAWGCLVLTFQLGRRYADAATGWLAALVLATSGMFVVHASAGVIDATLTFLVTAALATGLRAREERSPVIWAAFYGLIGLALITKGPVGLAIPAGVIFLLALQEDGRRVWAAHAAWGLLLSLCVAALWVLPAIARGGPEYAGAILLKQNLGRAWQSWHHKEPAGYFLKVFPASFLPWIVVLPTAIYGAARSFKRQRGSKLALTWFLFTFLFFSVISGKKTRYLLPLCPAASLLVAMELRAVASRAAGRLRSLLPLLAMAATVGLAGLALTAAGTGFGVQALPALTDLAADQRAAFLSLVTYPGSLVFFLPGLLIVTLALAILIALRWGRTEAIAVLATAWILLTGWAAWVAVPALNGLKSSRVLAEAVESHAGPAGPVILYRETFGGVFNLHLRRDRIPAVSGLSRIDDFLRDNPGGVVIAHWRDTQRLQSRVPALLAFECRRIGEDTVCASRLSPPTQ